MKKILSSIIIITILVLQGISAHAGFMPYGKIYKAAKDDRSYMTQAHDSRLQLELHKSILLNSPSSLVNISSYVFLGHGFLVGVVENEAERENLIKYSKNVQGLNGISYYLPVKNKTADDSSSALEIKLKGMIEPDYPSSKLTVKVVQNKVVILGVLEPDEQKKFAIP